MPRSNPPLLGTFTENFTFESRARWAKYAVSFPATPKHEMVLMGAELYQVVESHDVLVLTFKGKPFLESTNFVSGDPVKFTYSTGVDKSTFVGYIYKIKPVSDIKTHITRMICVSASYVLKNSKQQIFKNVTADQVVSKVCARHGLATVTQRHPRLRDNVVQSGQSDWQLLQRLARQTGFALKVENTTVFFLSKSKIYASKKDGAPYFKYQDGQNLKQRTTGSCLFFEPVVSDEAVELGTRVERVITGISSSTGEVISATHSLKDYTKPELGVVTVPDEDYLNDI